MTDKISDSLGKGGDGAQLGKSMYNDLPDKMERRIQYVVERLYKKYAEYSGVPQKYVVLLSSPFTPPLLRPKSANKT